MWDPATGEPSGQPLTGHEGTVRDVAFNSDGLLASVGYDGTVRLWDPATGEELDEWVAQEGKVFGVALGPDGTQLAPWETAAPCCYGTRSANNSSPHR